MADKDTKETKLSKEQTTQKKTPKKQNNTQNKKTGKSPTKKKSVDEKVVDTASENTASAPVEPVPAITSEDVNAASTVETDEEPLEDTSAETSKEVADSPNAEKEEETLEAASIEADTDAQGDEEDSSKPMPIMNIEHFSDYKSAKLENTDKEEEVDSGDAAEKDGEEEIKTATNKENLPDAEQYENLTILDHGLFSEVIPEGAEKRLPEKDVSQKEEEKEDPDSQKYNPEKPRRIDNRFEFIELFVFTLVAVMLITTFLFRHSVVEGESMENTLFENEHLIITDVFYKPKAGDIVVFEDYSTGYTTAIVKRVIAVEGQTVRIAPEGVYVDGVLLDNEDYVRIDTENYNYLTGANTDFLKDYTIPEGEVFVMGDHRDHSSDSRTFGTIGEETILGKVILRFYPFDKFGSVYKDD